MYRMVSHAVLASLLLLLLSACGSSSLGRPANLVVPGVKTVVTGGGALFGTAFSMVNAAALGPTSLESLSLSDSDALSSQSLAEVQEGLYVGMVTDVDDAGTVTLNLPAAEEIPGDTLEPASDAFLAINSQTDCSATSQPASVEMSVNFFNVLGYPAFLGLFADGGDIMLGLGVMSDQALDLTTSLPAEFTVYQWIYSDGSAVVSFEGTDCGPYLASQIDFAKGWNLVGWHVTDSFTTDAVAELFKVVDEPESLYLNLSSPFAVTSLSSGL